MSLGCLLFPFRIRCCAAAACGRHADDPPCSRRQPFLLGLGYRQTCRDPVAPINCRGRLVEWQHHRRCMNRCPSSLGVDHLLDCFCSPETPFSIYQSSPPWSSQFVLHLQALLPASHCWPPWRTGQTQKGGRESDISHIAIRSTCGCSRWLDRYYPSYPRGDHRANLSRKQSPAQNLALKEQRRKLATTIQLQLIP